MSGLPLCNSYVGLPRSMSRTGIEGLSGAPCKMDSHMSTTKTAQPVHVAARVDRFSYAIRNIVAEARAVQARGMRVRYMNIGDPVAAGFQTPPHLIEAVQRAIRDGHNGYLPSAGLPEAREALEVGDDGDASASPDAAPCGALAPDGHRPRGLPPLQHRRTSRESSRRWRWDRMSSRPTLPP